MANHRIEGNLQITGTAALNAIAYPAGSIGNAAIAEAAAIAASKIVHQFPVRYAQPFGADVVSETAPLHLVHGSQATVHRVMIACALAPAGGNRLVTIDLQRAGVGGGWSSILAAPAVYDFNFADRQILSPLIASPILTAGQWLRVVATVSGSSGTQAQGLIVQAMLRERAD